MTVQLAKQQQVCTGFDNNIKALGYLIQKTGTGVEVPSVESLKNVTGYKGTLRTVIAARAGRKRWLKSRAAYSKNLVAAACEEKIVAMTLDDKRDELNNEALVKEQKAVDEIAAQCWLRQKCN